MKLELVLDLSLKPLTTEKGENAPKERSHKCL
jgi:hypothetical protein